MKNILRIFCVVLLTSISFAVTVQAATVVLTSNKTVTNLATPFTLTITFNTDVAALGIGDIVVTNGTKGAFLNPTPLRVWTLVVTPDGLGDITCSIGLNVIPETNNAASLTVTYDNTAPTVTNVTSTKANGSYTTGEVIQILVTFSEPINTSGTPTITLENGSSDRVVNNTTGTGTNTLVFPYTVIAGDNSLDLDYVAATLTGTINDAAGNAANLTTLPAPGTTGSLGKNKGIIIDTSKPLFSGVSSSSVDGTYIVGKTLYVSVIFGEPVFVTGSPKLKLNTGATVPYAKYFGGSGTTTLKFYYTVQSGDVSADLDYFDDKALILKDGATTLGTIKDLAGNSAGDALETFVLLGAPGNGFLPIIGEKLVIDGIKPQITDVIGVSDTYYSGTIDITIKFDEAVKVTGTPRLLLETGSVDQYATYFSGGGGAGSTDLVFHYSIQLGDVSSDLNYKSTTSLYLNGGSIKDVNGNVAILTLPLSTGLVTGHSLSDVYDIKIDRKAPTVTNVSSNKANGYYTTGELIDIRVTFSEIVFVTGTPTITLENGTSNRVVNYSSGSASNTLVFNYTVGSGDANSDLDYVATSLSLGGGTIDDADVPVGNTANLTLPAPGGIGSLSRNKAIEINTNPPTITSVSSPNLADIYIAGQMLYVNVVFNEPVIVTVASPRLKLANGGAGQYATYVSGSRTKTLKFRYIVQSGDVNADLDYTGVDAFELNGASIKDYAGNAATADPGTLTLPAPGIDGLITSGLLEIDGVKPTISSVSATSGTKYTGETVDISILFDEAVYVTGTPKLQLETGATDRFAYYSGVGSTTNTIHFTYTVQAGDVTSDLNYKSVTSLFTNGGTIKDNHGNTANLTLKGLLVAGSLGVTSDIVVTSAPTVRFVTSTSANGTYSVGDHISISVVFSKNIKVLSGSVDNYPKIKLNSSATAYAKYKSYSTNTIVFDYQVASGDASLDLDYAATDALELISATIVEDAVGSKAAVLTLPAPGAYGSLGRSKAIIVNGTAKAPKTLGANFDGYSPVSLEVYPIPSNGNFTVEYSGFNTSEVNIAVYDLLGRNVYSAKSSSVKESVSVSLNPGTYVMVVNNDTQKTTKRIVIE